MLGEFTEALSHDERIFDFISKTQEKILKKKTP